MKTMNYQKEELGYFTTLYKLKGREDLKLRYIAYNDILFKNINILAEEKKQIIIINEVGNGGVIFGNIKYIDLALKKLKESLKSQSKYIVQLDKNIKDNNAKISFKISNNWNINI